MDYKHLKDVYVIYILIEITSLRLSRVFLFFIVIFFICVFIFNVQYTAYYCVSCLAYIAKLSQKEV